MQFRRKEWNRIPEFRGTFSTCALPFFESILITLPSVIILRLYTFIQSLSKLLSFCGSIFTLSYTFLSKVWWNVASLYSLTKNDKFAQILNKFPLLSSKVDIVLHHTTLINNTSNISVLSSFKKILKCYTTLSIENWENFWGVN